MTKRNFLIDSGIQKQMSSPAIAPSYKQGVQQLVQEKTGEPEYVQYGLESQEEFELMQYVKDKGGNANDFGEILEDYRRKRLPEQKIRKTNEVNQDEQKISGLDIGVKTGKGISEFGKQRKVEGAEFPGGRTEAVNFALTTLKNIPGDGLEAIGETVEFVSDPVGAVKGVKDLAQGIIFKGLRNIWNGATGEELTPLEEEQTVNAATEYLKENYGSLDKASKTITENPIDTIFVIKGILQTAKKANPDMSEKIDKVNNTLPKKLNEKAKGDIEKALGATKEKYKQMSRDLTPGITQRGITGSKQSIQELAESQKSKYGKQIQDYVESGKLSGTVQRDDLLNVLDDIRKQGQIDDVIIDQNIVNATDKFADAVSGFGKEIPAEKARILRQILDDAVYSTKGVVSEEALSLKNNIKNQLANTIREQLAKQNPELDLINKEFSFYSKLDEVLTETLNRQGPQQGGLVSNIAGGGGLGAGAVVFGDLSGAIATGVALKGLTEAMRSTQWRTVSAKLKNNLADALSSGNQNQVTKATNQVLKEVYGNRSGLYIGGQTTETNLELNEE